MRHPPEMADLASRAISDALRARARRSWLAAASGALAVVVTLVAGGTIALRASGAGSPTADSDQIDRTRYGGIPSTSGSELSLIIEGRTLSLPGGKPISLTSIAGGAQRGSQTEDGWLLWGSGETSTQQSLWLAKPDGSLRCLVANVSRPVAVAADGRQLSWNDGSRLLVGRIDQSGAVEIEYQTPAQAEVSPTAIVGDTVLLTQTTETTTKYDTWQPKRGDYRPTWTSTVHVKQIYGAGLDANTVIGLVPGPASSSELCLARLNPADTLATTEVACGVLQAKLESPKDSVGVVSPNGRRLAVGTDDHVTVLDLATAFAPQASAILWDAARPGVWVDSTTMVAPDRNGVLRRFQDKAPAGEPVRLSTSSEPALADRVVPVGRLP